MDTCLVTAVLVKQNEEDGHNDNNAEHNSGIRQRIPDFGSSVGSYFMEWRVNPIKKSKWPM